MHFEKHSRPTPYLNRRDQYRMLGMLALLMLIVVAIDTTRKPENWHWFFLLGGDARREQDQELRELRLDDIDYQIKPNENLAAETFIAVAENADSPSPSSRPDLPASADENLEQIPTDLLDGVSDQRLGLLRAEEGALQAILERVRSHSPESFLNAARHDVGYRVVNVEPEKYRGRLLYLEGTLWRLAPFPFGDPGSREDDLYQAWVFTSDSGSNPWMVLLPSQPSGIEAGDKLDRPVKVAGYFFKRYGYATEHGPYVAPMLIAGTLHVPPPLPPPRLQTENITFYVVGFLGTIAALFGVMILWFVRSDRKFDRSHLAEIAESRLDAPPEVVAGLNQLPAVDPKEVLRDIEGRSKQEEERLTT